MLQDDFAARLPAYKGRVKKMLETFIEAQNLEPGRLRDALIYAVSSDGKRIRPLLTYATAELLEIPAQVADYPATAVELIHAYSLIHDDLMDKDDLRRGKPTVHQRFDEPTAILLGDALQTLAFELLSQAEVAPDLVVAWTRQLAKAAGATGMIQGQAMDIEGESRPFVLEELETMHRKKSGSLIAASIMLPALARETLSEQTLSRLSSFGQHIGLAFQIRDDLLDIEATTAQLGKPRGSDLRNEKSTFVSLLGLEASRSRMYESLTRAETVLDELGAGAAGLRWLSGYITARTH